MSATAKQERTQKEGKQKKNNKQTTPAPRGRSAAGLARQQARKIRNLVRHSHLTPALAADVVAKRVTLPEAADKLHSATQDRRYERKLRREQIRRERRERYLAAIAQQPCTCSDAPIDTSVTCPTGLDGSADGSES